MKTRIIPLVLTTAVLLAGCRGSGEPMPAGKESTDGGRIKVVVSAYPLAYASEQVGRDRISMRILTPGGSDPHDVEITPEDLKLLHEAALIVFVGAGFQSSVEKTISQLPAGQRLVLDALTGLGLNNGSGMPSTESESSVSKIYSDRAGMAHGDDHAGDGGEEGHVEDYLKADPHFWLDPSLMARSASLIADHLARIDPEHANYYRGAYSDFESRLDVLDAEFTRGLAVCKRRTILVTHLAFGYLAEKYTLTQVALKGVSSHSETTAGSIASAKKVALETGATTVFTEPGEGNKVAETLAREIGGEVSVLDPLEVQRPGIDYFSVMRENLRELRKALECE